MTPFEIAQGYIGTTEGPGPEDNPAIMAMYASVGQLEDAALPALLIIAVGLVPVAISLKLLDNLRRNRRG